MGIVEWPFVGERGQHLRRLLVEAAEPALEQIRRDRERPQQFYPMHDAFDYLAERLYSVELSVERLFAARGGNASKAYQSFQTITGTLPATYIEERRLETAVGLLLADRSVTLGETALCSGYAAIRTFRRAFERWAGMKPGEFLRHVDQLRRRGAPSPVARSFTSGWAARFNAEVLTEADSQPVLDWLGATGPPPGSPDYCSTRAWLAGIEGEWLSSWWPGVRTLPAAQLRAALLATPFKTAAVCEFLCERSREEGRDDCQRGVVVVELALAALDRLTGRLPARELEFWQAKVLGCVGYARVAALDLTGAEAALCTAAGFLACGEHSAELRAEIAFDRSVLRCAQRRLPEALELADAALRWLGERPGRLQAQILLARAQVLTYQGKTEQAIPDFCAAIAVLEGAGEPYLSWTAHQNLAGALLLAGRSAEAATWLQGARALAARLGRLAAWCHTLWLEGLLADQQGRAEDAAARLREACEGFQSLGVAGEAAVAALDLAMVEAGRGAHESALRWAGQALPHLECLHLEREGLAALALLRQGVEARQLSAEVVAEARRHAARAAGVAGPPPASWL